MQSPSALSVCLIFWGGKTSLGLDCSGLVQIALTACGLACPRDADMQEQALGEAVAPSTGISNLQRGDLIFWTGHVAIVRDAASLIHASVLDMAVAIEAIGEATARIRAAGSEITKIRADRRGEAHPTRYQSGCGISLSFRRPSLTSRDLIAPLLR